MERNDLWLNVKGNCILLFGEYFINSCGLSTATIEYLCLSVCVSVCVQDNSKK